MKMLIVVLLVGAVALCGALMASTPWLMPATEAFAVTVPSSARENPAIRQWRRSYCLGAVVLTVVGSLIALGSCTFLADADENAVAFLWLYCLAAALPLVGCFGLMLHYRRKVQALKASQGWHAAVQQSTAVIDEPEVPRPVSMWWNLLYVPLVLVTVGLVVFNYDKIPGQIPMHVGFDGTVTNYVPKTPLSAGFPVIMEVFLGVIFAFSLWTIRRSRKAVDPDRPQTSAYAYGLFAHAQGVFLLVMGLVITGACGVLMALSSFGAITMASAAIIVTLLTILACAGGVVLAVVYGQNGSRVFRRLEGTDAMPADNDEHWKLGVFYVNRDDPAVFVPERFGVGWTCNWGRPLAWGFLGGMVLLCVVLCWLCFAMG
ncbi:DUF1648 domain-containing protein [Olsenella sp. YH-ols2217]|uniref:DUF1648 domain-containing protein n=1 Tax=Kribbibacterium absianum TaxID=3044210 RepID=A0ABT6ZI32_9ACTN|nr:MULTISPECIES: DUF5808 domain-containing protein [unclassified Olsenella]MDJ1121220.1 DUF1648 domain-containing protein [Olsenella sp. YH-ols2216]MDJ1128710.1 DUF1648 domain-containing protein [Olsenella sp. YH-ols2217]